MSSDVIEVEKLGKRYRIQVAETDARSLRASLGRGIRQGFHVLSPFHAPRLEERDYWALRDVSFSVAQGEKLAIIGKNGSGKTTLLKILSRITMPSTGSAKIRGRLSCLLQAGTGFHPELSGRENIFMSGIILGMTRHEVRQRFDAIVDFSGVQEFIDTPIKHYSTGMQARLGFSVAAHLDSDIMLIDEGLASGDAGFKAKATGKIRELSESGRTVLLVSHDAAIIHDICSRALVFERGSLIADTTDLASLSL